MRLKKSDEIVNINGKKYNLNRKLELNSEQMIQNNEEERNKNLGQYIGSFEILQFKNAICSIHVGGGGKFPQQNE